MSIIGCVEIKSEQVYFQAVDPNASHRFAVHLMNDLAFKQVIVSIDETKIYDGKPSEDPVTGVIKIISYSLDAPEFAIKIVVPEHQVEKEQKVNISDASQIAVYLTDRQEILIEQKEVIEYD